MLAISNELRNILVAIFFFLQFFGGLLNGQISSGRDAGLRPLLCDSIFTRKDITNLLGKLDSFLFYIQFSVYLYLYEIEEYI